MYNTYVKRFLDLVLGITAFTLLLPVFILVTVVLFILNRGKPFFFQTRPGMHGKLFKVIKFRTMNDFRDEQGELLPDEDRLTNFGIFVRKTSLDEIPQLLNVIKGDMSLVGPRPLLLEYLTLYNEEQLKRHNVRPGITGWSQINGRNAITWEKRFADDIWYVNNISFVLDLKILMFTILKVFKAEGISSPTSVTMEKFKGNEQRNSLK